jgi:hypothetical protein
MGWAADVLRTDARRPIGVLVQGTDARRWAPRGWTALVVSLGLALAAAAPASAQVAEGRQADPAGDQVVTPAGAHAGLDLAGASVRYDSGAGELRLTYRGTITVGSHSRTTYDGVISQTSSPGAGCTVAAAGDATFSGSTFDSSGGGNPRGTGRLEVAGSGPVDGVVLLPPDGSVVFVFRSPIIQNLGYRCAGALHAMWMDATNATADDQVAPFCVVAGCFDTPSVVPVATTSTSEADSAVATGGAAAATGSRARPDTLFVSRGLTARVASVRGGLDGLLGRGLTIPVTCSSGCWVHARVSAGGIVVGRGSITCAGAGVASLRLRVDGDARWSLAHRTSARVTVALTVSDGDGAHRTLVRRLLLR